MRDYFSNRGTFTNINVAKLDAYDPNSPTKGGTIWSTEKINKLIKDHEDGLVDIAGYKNSPFLSNNIEHRKPRINFSYTKYEMDELRKCAADPIYFGEKYCKLFTEKGYVSVKLRDYQQGIIEGIHEHRNCIIMASRQIGKCLSFSTLVNVLYKNEEKEVPLYWIYFKLLKDRKMLSFKNYILYVLYYIIFYIDKKTNTNE